MIGTLKFFHLSTLCRRNSNKIRMLKNDDGVWVSDVDQIKSLALNYFQSYYSDEVSSLSVRIMRLMVIFS